MIMNSLLRNWFSRRKLQIVKMMVKHIPNPRNRNIQNMSVLQKVGIGIYYHKSMRTVQSGAGVGVGMFKGRGMSFLVSRFQHFLVSWPLGFFVLWGLGFWVPWF